MANERPFLAFRFDVQINVPSVLGLTNPLCNAAFAECDGLEMTMEVRAYRERPGHRAGSREDKGMAQALWVYLLAQNPVK